MVLLALSCSSRPAQQPTENAEIAHAIEATIVLYDQDGELACAGQRVAEDRVLTAYHCAVAAALPMSDVVMIEQTGLDFSDVPTKLVVGKGASFSTYDQIRTSADDKAHAARESGVFVAVDRKADLALIATSVSSQRAVSIASNQLRIGQPVFSIGHPVGMEFTFAAGHVSTPCRIDDMLGEGCWTQVDMTTLGGSSGGGLYTQDGELVGVCSKGNDVQSYFSPLSAIVELMRH